MSTHAQFFDRIVDLESPKPEDISFPLIALALSRLCRFNGATTRFYSVAEHCARVAELARRRGHGRRVQLLALLHDAHEAYLGDVTRPVAVALAIDDAGDRLAWLKELWDEQICKAAGLMDVDARDLEIVEQLDLEMLVIERASGIIDLVVHEAWDGLPDVDMADTFKPTFLPDTPRRQWIRRLRELAPSIDLASNSS